ncbi:hypothetical protein Thiowin_01054 [Thiorhodovibrio winogradskyi]|uniref:PEP-CTERM protein-sorting domain-containing protein n=1 Tax=Thiorhodovibrio winogradskyi TaxID=77007 RepID=A0ABZ0S720_9GAMM|nr:hypothetical protein [Thiorhodovibrio winogradskyi]
MRILTILSASAAGALLLSGPSYATVFPYTPSVTGAIEVQTNTLAANHLSSVQITGIYKNDGSLDLSDLSSATNIITGSPLDSTGALGFVTSPDNDWGKTPSPNIGELYDGLLNGEVGGPGQGDYYVDPSYFLTNQNDSWVDENTPGWISLATSDYEGENAGEWFSADALATEDENGDPIDPISSYGSVNGYDLSQVLDISFTSEGTWSLLVDPSAIQAATIELGRPTIFDHLAFVLKGSNNADASWAIFDFNFWDLIDKGLDISLGDTVYYFTGRWDTGVINNQDLSHVTIWAHDPPAGSTSVPAPTPLALLGVGLLAMGFSGRRGKRR